ncbi:unnamed protein product [Dicrocoelium dendriticum]|nr:unnamed protein product [Dicrocoelium dendriticum]
MFPLQNLGYFKTPFSFCVLLFLAASVEADTPANCTYEDAHGRWLFEICNHPNNCSGHAKEKQVMDLLYPNLVDVVSGYGNGGYWTLIYNQGFEVTVAHRKWLVMFAFGPDGESFCDQGIPGWSHDSLLRQWRWFSARKVDTLHRRIVHKSKVGNADSVDLDQFYRTDLSFINQINSVQNSWTATHYPELERYTLRELRRRTGGDKSAFPKPLKLKQPTSSPELLQAIDHLPEEFDWRYPSGGQPSPITPVRDQSSCGSCYAFASAAALEARVRIWSNFTRLPILSPQDVVDCSPYSEGCDGGFPYLIVGKYAEDYGIPEESCNPYTGVKSDICPTKRNCSRYYATNYHYLGGYYGACSEHLMKLELVTNGPFPVGFEVYDDFIHYRSGVYSHTTLKNPLTRFDPFEMTNHAVMLVGYGFDKKLKLPYWIVKNSWGPSWGEDGYFRILRGSDECSIESLGVAFDPVL